MIKIYKRSEISTEQILERSEQTIDVEGIVSDIIKNVKENGDKALVEYCKKFDGALDDVIEVTDEEINEALNEVDDELINILKEAKENITAFHSKQVRNSFIINEKAIVNFKNFKIIYTNYLCIYYIFLFIFYKLIKNRGFVPISLLPFLLPFLQK